MFLKEALLRYSQLEDEIASIFDSLAASTAATSENAASWSEASRKERLRARLLHALAEISTALDDDGPFLVQVPVQMAGLERVLDNVRRWLSAGLDAATGERCVEALSAAPRQELHAALLEIAEPEMKRAMRLVDSEIRSVRRVAERARTRSGPRTRESCATASH
jgi:hypothetical protein